VNPFPSCQSAPFRKKNVISGSGPSLTFQDSANSPTKPLRSLSYLIRSLKMKEWMSPEAESWERRGLRKEASPIELMINWLTFWGGREPTKIMLIARRMRKRIGETRRSVLIFRGCFPSSYSGFQILIIEEKRLLHNLTIFKQHLTSSFILQLFSVVNLFFLRTIHSTRSIALSAFFNPHSAFRIPHSAFLLSARHQNLKAHLGEFFCKA
jgi:hypothetical protein